MPRRATPADPAERARIVAAAVATMGELGPARSKLSLIAQRAGVAYGTLYRHFPSRDALLLAALLDQTHAVERLWDHVASEADPVERIIMICSAPLENVRRVPGLRAAVVGVESIQGAEEEVARQYQAGVALLSASIRDAQRSGKFSQFPPEVLATMLMGLAASYFTVGTGAAMDSRRLQAGIELLIRKLA